MEQSSQPLRDRLLAQFKPDSDRLAQHRKKVQIMLEQNEQTLRRQKWYAGGIWIFVVAMGTAFLVLGGMRGDAPVGVWFGILACYFTIGPAIELLKYFINRSRVELLKEIKGLELQLMEIKERLNRSEGGA